MRYHLAFRVAARWIRAKQHLDYKKYVDDKRKKGEKPLPRDEWETKVLGKGKDKKEPGKGGAPESVSKWEQLTKKELPFDRKNPDKKLRFQVPFGMRDPAKGLQKAVTEALSKANSPKPKIDFKGLKGKVDDMESRLQSWKAHGDEAKWKKEMQGFVSGAKEVIKDLKKQHGGLMSRLFKRADDERLWDGLVRLAAENPEIRRHVVPILREFYAQQKTR